MTDSHPGLRKRLEVEARRISAQHRQLKEFAGLLERARREQDARAMGEAFERFRAALDAHFEVEESTHFPAIHGLDPGSEAELQALVQEHAEFREQLGSIAGELEAGGTEGPGRALEGLLDRLAAHERSEEQLMARATGVELPAAEPRV